ncbi:MAG: FKBP-type peptidyl-prolyl cis-trans isomerase [Lachnospiraceae bacterium]|nr:FKBP-type peptidyl-prolyl cis-trans isomerase [Lachnospiraceae bacterium]MDE6940800.1 FKBP-type peptidyl-prolyl cis-trans isomerase [Lachnospiraceae bacterium]
MAKKDKETVREEKNETSDISKSKAKREQRKKEIAREKQRRRTAKIIGGVAVAAIVAVIAAAVGQNVYLSSMRTTPSDDFSAGLTADGRIEGVNVRDALTLVDYANIAIPADEVRATDEEVEGDINATLQAHREASTDETLEIKDGDTVNIDYVGTIDGVAFEGGDSNGAGYDLTIGSGSFIDDFEQQLIGHRPGEELTVEATFPENYRNDDTVAGKDASFAVTINSITVTPEFTDEFVAKNFSEEGFSTAEAYRASVEDRFYEQHLEDYLADYIIENSTVKSYPSDYLKQLRALTKYNDESMLASYNQMFSSYGMAAYENPWDMMDEDINDELSYEKDLRERAKETAKTAMVYQAIYEDAGLTIDLDAAIAELSETYGEEYMADMRATQGDGYLAQAQIQEAVMDYLMERYKTE